MKRDFAPRALFLMVVISFALAGVPAAAAPVVAPEAISQLEVQRPCGPLTACSDLFISEYVEGSSNNKALEIYNPTASAVSLNGYDIIVYFNGASTGTTLALTTSASVAAGDVWLFCASAASFAASCDQITTTSLWNGDDAIVLRHSGTIIDSIGQVGFDPGTEWGTGLVSTADNTIRRKAAIQDGDEDASDVFTDELAAEWDGYANDTSTGLGSHTMDPCGGGDVPPTVSSTVPTSGATGVSTGTTITVNFSEIIDATASAFTVACPVGTLVTFNSSPALPANDTSSIVLTPTSPLPAGTTCTVTAVATQITDNDGTIHQLDGDKNGTGGDNYVFTFTTAAPPTITKIHAIQGSGSTAASGTFSVEAIVIGDYQGVTGTDDYKLDGFFIQEEDADADANAATSEGIFVYCLTCPTNVVVGDKVQVTGATSEYYDMSQLNATTAGAVVVVSSGNALPTPAALTLPVPGVTATDLAGATAQINAYYEQFEGMLVKFGTQLSVTEYFELFRYGQVVLAQGGRFRQFTDIAAPSTTGYTAHQIDLVRRTVILDDDSNQQNHALAENPDIPVFHPVPGGFSITNYFRGGDTITDLTGVLHYSFAGLNGTDAWRIRPVMNASSNPVFNYSFTSGNPRTTAPASVDGNIKVGSFNTLNFFTTIDTATSDTSGPCAPSGTMDCRGADSAAELTQQRAKLVAAICGLNADVLGLMELENPRSANDPESGDGIADYVLNDLVGALNATGSPCTDKTYAFTDNTNAGTDAIRVGIIYKTSSVTPVGTPVALTAAAFTDPNNTGSQKSRPALAQTFEEKTWGERFTLVVNHLKSKGCDGATGLDADQGDGQGCWNDTRQKAAAYLVNTWLPSDPTGSGDPDFVVVGDLNAYRLEAPITNITTAGYADLIHTLAGASAYGYVFDGQLGYLDHALSSAALTPQVIGATEWHINADEVNLLDYNDTVKDTAEDTFDAKPTATTLYEANAYRSSDHDPVLVGLGLYPDLSDLAAYGVAWHTGQGAVWRLGTTWTGDPTSGTGTDSDDGVARNYNDSWNDTRAEVYVTVAGPASKWACLNAWLDYSDGTVVANTVETPNGAFDVANEHVVSNLPIQAGSGQLVTWPLEQGVINSTATYNMRFRLTPDPNNDGNCGDVTLAAAAGPLAPDGGAQPTGRADGGEVEDYGFNPGPLAVTLASFTAAASPSGVTLAWETVSETDNAGFSVYRAGSEAGAWVKLTPALIPSAAPGSSEGHAYTWTDATAAPGAAYWYQLEDVAFDGTLTRHAPVQVAAAAAPNAVGLAAFGGAAAVTPALPGAFALIFALAALAGVTRRR